MAEIVWTPDEQTLAHANVVRLMRRHGMWLNHVEYVPNLHGGTLRWHIGKTENRSETVLDRRLTPLRPDVQELLRTPAMTRLLGAEGKRARELLEALPDDLCEGSALKGAFEEYSAAT